MYTDIVEVLKKYENFNCYIQIIDDDNVTSEDIIRNADVYITNRSSYNVKNTCIADLFSTKIISGVDKPIFS